MSQNLEQLDSELSSSILELSVPLHQEIEIFDVDGISWLVAGMPGAAFFTCDGAGTLKHVSGSPTPGLMEHVMLLQPEHMARAEKSPGTTNSHLPPLLLLCAYMLDDTLDDRFDLRRRAARPASVLVLDEEEAEHDPNLEPHDSAIRAWVPLTLEDDSEAHSAVMEFRFHAERHSRYVPAVG